VNWPWLLLLTGCLAALLYWLLVTTEGTYLGRRTVALMYDWTASQYEKTKQFRHIDEQLYVGVPLAERLSPYERPLVLDVATGTARVPLALVRSGVFEGRIIGGDRSGGMLREARSATKDMPQVNLLRLDAEALPFADGSFEAVTCLEALEFIPNAHRALEEIGRVLKPGGFVLLSNRVGAEAALFPGRISRRGRLEEALRHLGFVHIRAQRWQVYYDLVWAGKRQGPDLRENHIAD